MNDTPDETHDPLRYLGRDRTAVERMSFHRTQILAAASRMHDLERQLDAVRQAQAALTDVPEPAHIPGPWVRGGTVVLASALFGLAILWPDAYGRGLVAWLAAAALLGMLDLGAVSATRAQRGLEAHAPSLLTVILGCLVGAAIGAVAGTLLGGETSRIAGGALALGLGAGWLLWIYHQVRRSGHIRASIENDHRRLAADRERIVAQIEREERRQKFLYADVADRTAEVLEELDGHLARGPASGVFPPPRLVRTHPDGSDAPA